MHRPTSNPALALSRVTPVSMFGRLAVLGVALALSPMLPVPAGQVAVRDDARIVQVACLVTDYRKGQCDRPTRG
ncbi:hypothetical protein PRN20_16070 [Devosia sp. ZB163]|uniref:hypothetical protein n=1 Tax=Devosia sp. ZB163 TaxID=3025938 RepID=UPI00235E9C15|nr:hypothetical protein [Devosia sp. ZB163]MDC9825247.1 hypothetical protein [Devosia sp. ZB163]